MALRLWDGMIRPPPNHYSFIGGIGRRAGNNGAKHIPRMRHGRPRRSSRAAELGGGWRRHKAPDPP